MPNIFKQFCADEKGSVFVLVALSSLLMIMAGGAAIDMARAQTLQAKISSSLDAAGLAAGATASSVDPTTQATRYFNANFPTGYLNSGAVTLNITCADMNGNTVTCSSASTYTINLSASTREPTTFMKVVGINSIPVSANSQITRQTSGLELALVLDNTGSMGNAVNGGSVTTSNPAKIDALKCALAGDAAFGTTSTRCENEGLVTSGLLDILYGNNNTLSDLFIGVVPFSDMVNLNITAAPGSSFVNNVTASNKTSMGGCVDSRSYSINSTTDSGISVPVGEGPITLDISDDPPSSSSSNTYFQALIKSGNSTCPKADVQPMSLYKSDAVATIKSMTANGSTMIQLGFAWGWRMLSPNWTGLWGSTPTFTYPDTTTTVQLPLPYNTEKMLKVIVLMTDGVNTTAHSDSAYENFSTYPDTTTKLDKLTYTVCDAIKSKGIIVYTIGFGSSSDIDTTLLKHCATQNYTGDTSHYFLAPSNADLEAAFQQIGDQLANLRVSQ
ncbi:MAG TPA: hypothetical protein VFT64_11190 [Rickettsiales bacterium]|nr:hypothetical protein [Rickettsiales bacterium]